MFSAELIRKKVTKATRPTRDKSTTLRKRKNKGVPHKPLTTRKKARPASSGGGGGAAAHATTSSTATTTTTTTAAAAASITDINKNKMNQPTLKKKNKGKNQTHKNNTTTLEEEDTSEEKVAMLYRNTNHEEDTTHHQDAAADLDTAAPHHHHHHHQDSDSSFIDSGNEEDSDYFAALEDRRDPDNGEGSDCEDVTDGVCEEQEPGGEGEDKAVIGECLMSVATEKGSVVAAIEENTTLYFQGCVELRPLLGSVEVLGYVICKGFSQVVHSLPSCSLLGMAARHCAEVDAGNCDLNFLPASWLEDLVAKKTKVTLVEVIPHKSQRLNMLVGTGWSSLAALRNPSEPWDSVGVSVVTPKDHHKTRVVHIKTEWRLAAQMVYSYQKFYSEGAPRVVVCGGKGVGKSTLFKYLANLFVVKRPTSGLLCVDLDPGQPELSLPATVSLTHLRQPLLGPPYIHDVKKISSYHTELLVGSVNPQFVLEEYIRAVQKLCKVAVKVKCLPLVVNTMGWTHGTGLAVMLDVLRMVQPTHVLQIQDHRAARNYPFPLTAAAVAEARPGIATRPGGTELHYSLMLLPSGGSGSAAPNMAQPKVQRELRVLAEAVRITEERREVTVPWGSVALHVCEEEVPRERLLQVINAQLVALCHVDPADLQVVGEGLPHCLSSSGASYGKLVGWAVVKGINTLTHHLHLTTDLPSELIAKEVNAIIMPRVYLPTSFYKQYSLAGKCPYLEKTTRKDAGRLRVGRRIKPRGPRQ